MKIISQTTRNGKKICYDHPVLMGILNVTEDSFFDGGRYSDFDSALKHAEFMVKNGAEIIDIGGESTRPGAKPVSENEEIERVIPVVEKICKEFDVIVSVDTYKSRVAEETLKAGADIINDISGFTFDERMPEIVSRYNAIAVITHIKGKPENMQKNPEYKNVKVEVFKFFKNSIEKAIKAKLKRENLILDVGIGFGKKLIHNLELLRKLDYFKKLNLPLLIGVSRKSMIGMVLGETDEMNEKVKPPEERLYGTLAVNAYAYFKGANIFRVHDVKEHFEFFKLLLALKS
ncbi:MAG: dihydropteroate synthase [Brevinematia bacterium]